MSRVDFSWHRRAQESIAQASLTNSKRPASLVEGVYPTHLEKGSGCHVWDTEGRKYIDFICGLGTNILGYGSAPVTQAVTDQLRSGSSLSLSTKWEVLAAEKLKEIFPFVDCWKFLKTGSEACLAAIKIARAATGRELVLSSGYHGWGDDFVSLSTPALGVPKMQGYRGEAIDDLPEDLEYDWDQVAAVIVEPVMTDDSEERRAWLQRLREICTAHGVMLIFDEVITGFRFPRYSVARYWNIDPDLIVIGKAMANGFPLAAVGGRYSAMNTEYFVSSTYAGEIPSLVACLTVVKKLQKINGIGHLWEHGKRWQAAFNAIWPEGVRLEGYPTRGRFVGGELAKALFFQESCKAGILFGPSWFLSFAHLEAEPVMEALKAILGRIRAGSVTLEGKLPRSPFAQEIRHGKGT